MAIEKACFAAGCFWGVEAVFRQLPGVVTTTVGYTGGHLAQPTYQQVCTDTTGHAEAVLVEFDTEKVSYEDLLKTFWACHDPTQVNRQGPDLGSQYRSAIFYCTDRQREAALRSTQDLERSGRLPAPIATELTAAGEFYPAEDYHQQYLEKRGQASCHIRYR